MHPITNFVDDAIIDVLGHRPGSEELSAYGTAGWCYLDENQASPTWKLTPFGEMLKGTRCLAHGGLSDEEFSDDRAVLSLFAINLDACSSNAFRDTLLRFSAEGLVCRSRDDRGRESTAVTAKGFFCGRTYGKLTDSDARIFAALRDMGLMERRFESEIGDWRWSPTERGFERGLGSPAEAAISVLSKLELGRLLTVEIRQQVMQLQLSQR